jgi:acyl-CoA synthetase (AMP-forming)/AMP-acid ligase II/acetyltransferase-like isoleucine patch superfamily enzyme/acyl carrier protein
MDGPAINNYIFHDESLTSKHRDALTYCLELAQRDSNVDRAHLIALIPLQSDCAPASLRLLTSLLDLLPGSWPTFDLSCCYSKLWNLLPESVKSGKDTQYNTLLESLSRHMKNTYSNVYSLLPKTDTPAIYSASSSTPLSHKRVASFVSRFGLPVCQIPGKRSVVALALPNGPVLGLALLATTNYYTAAPLTVASGPEQFQSDVLQSGASVVLVTKPDVERLGLHAPWVQQAGIKVILVEAKEDSTFDLTCTDGSPVIFERKCLPNRPDDIALVLFTSGTSGKKKVVPYTVHTITSGVAFVIESWGLTKHDRCINMMPLFHVGGIVRNLFAPIMAGGSTICCPAFDANLFWDVVEDLQPTWYYASPSMHSVILEEGHNRPVALKNNKIRLVCNAAGGLLPSLAITLRDTFGCIVLPSYGMTECMPIASPPLDYRLDRPGTSGVSVGPDMAILDGNDNKLPIDMVGRIAVRGAPVFGGYSKEGDVLDTSCFTDAGWFDTGDMGYLDVDGYLYVTGRSKEVINRGGELISPFEIEEAVVTAAKREGSPLFGRVSAALAFSMPHDVLQEVPGVVLVTPPGARRADIKNIHDALKDSLSQVKWPMYIVYMDDLPKNNNKILRIKLAERLGLTEITDNTLLGDRHYEAVCPAPNTPLSTRIGGSVCSFDLALVSRKLSSVMGSDFDIAVRRASHDGYPEVFFAPRKNSTITPVMSSHPSFDSLVRSELDGYLIPSRVHFLDVPLPRDSKGSIDNAQLETLIEASPDEFAAGMSATEAKIADIFVKILSCSASELTPESDFFALGGDSLRAGRLLSELRKEFKVRLPIDLLFVYSGINALARNIDEMRGNVDLKQAMAQVEEVPVNVGCKKTYSSTNPIVLLIQLFPIALLYPMKRALTWTVFMYMLSATRDWITSTRLIGRLFNLVLALGIAKALTMIVCPLLAICLKWMLIGKYKEGMYPMWGFYHTRWWLADKIITVLGKGMFQLSEVSTIWYYRLMGAKIGKGVNIAKRTIIREFDLVTIEDGANLDQGICRAFGAEQNTSMYLGRVRVGKNASVGLGSIVAPGTSVDDNTCIGPNSSSWEANDASEEFRDLSASKIPGAHPVLSFLLVTPISLIVTLCKSAPWLGGLVGLVLTQPKPTDDKVKSIIIWFAVPHRIGWHFAAKIFGTMAGPITWFIAVWSIKQLLDMSIGKLTPGPAASRSQAQRLRMAVLKAIAPPASFHSITELFGGHYEATSVLYRAMGSKIGQRVYWPGTGPSFQDFDLLDIGSDVVFGSRSHLVTSDGTGSDYIRVQDGAMISDRVVLLPGVTVGKKSVLGSGALTRRNKYYEQETVWVGSKAGEAICLSGSNINDSKLSAPAPIAHHGIPSFTDTTYSSSVTLNKKHIVVAEKAIQHQGVLSSSSSMTLVMESEKERANTVSTSSTPFGRAFYEGKAPYHVFGPWIISLYSTFWTVFVSFYWNISSIGALQLVAYLIKTSDPVSRPDTPFRPVLIFSLFAAFIAVLHTFQALLALGIVIAAKWVLLGQRKQGNYNWDTSSYCQRWQLFLTIEKLRRTCYSNNGIIGLLTGTHYAVLYFRSLGASIGKDCSLFSGGLPSLIFTEPDLLTLGNRVAVDDASLVSHINSRGVFNLNQLKVGDGSVLRSGARLLSGADMGANTMLLEHTLVMAGDVVDDGTIYQGWPGELFEGGERAPLSSTAHGTVVSRA